MHKNLLDLPIQQERLGPRLTCKFFLGSCLFEVDKDRESGFIPQQSALFRRHPFFCIIAGKIGGVPRGGTWARYIEQRRRVIHLSHNLTPIYVPTLSWDFADCLTRGVTFHALPGRNRGHIGVNHTRFSFLRQSEIGKFLVII